MSCFLPNSEGIISGGDVDAEVFYALHNIVLIESDRDVDGGVGALNWDHLQHRTVVNRS